MRALTWTVVAVCAVASAAGGVAIPNGDFEQGREHWQIKDDGKSMILPDAAYRGKYGLRVLDESQSSGSEMQSEQVAIEPNRVYRLAFMARSTGASRGVGIYLQFYDQEGKCLTNNQDRAEVIYQFEAGSDWQPFKVQVKAPPKASAFALRIHSFNAEVGQADMDDFVLSVLSDSEAAALPPEDIMVSTPQPRVNVAALRLQVDRDDLLARLVRAKSAPHPRLFADAAGFTALRAAAQEPGLHQRYRERLVFLADGLLTVPPCERVMTGRRLLHISRLALYRISTLALSYRISGNKAYRDRCLDEMRAVASFSDWNPAHFLDVGEMTLALATGYDWLYDELSPADRELCAQAIISKGLKSTPLDAHWTRMGNNWGQVCHAGMIAGALAVADIDAGIAEERLYSAVTNLAIPMRVYAPNGNYPEGPGYWEYGTGFNVIALDMLVAGLGTDFGLSSLPGFRATGRYNDYMSGPSGFVYNYADGGRGRRRSQSASWWFAKHFAEPQLVAGFEREALEKLCSERGKINAGGNNGWYHAYVFFWLLAENDAGLGEEDQLPLVWDGQGPVPIVVMRSSWDNDQATYIALKAGSPRASHGHMDCGSFVLDAGRTRWALDLGAENYDRIEKMGLSLWDNRQYSDRWKLFRLNNFSHNTLAIDGQLQVAASNTAFLRVQSDPAEAVMDLTLAYATACQSAQRSVRLDADGVVMMRDELSGLKPGAVVQWGMTTDQKIQQQDDGGVTLSDGRQQFRVSSVTGGGTWRVVDVSQPQPLFQGDSRNANCHRLELLTPSPADGQLSIAVRLELLK